MSLIGTLLIGLLVGWVARWLKPGSDKMGLILTTVLGVAGAFFATYAGSFLGLYRPGEAPGLIGAVLGAIVLLYIVGAIKARQG